MSGTVLPSSGARIAVGGVVRQWNGNERTGINAAYFRSLLNAGALPILLSPLLGAARAGAALDGCDALLLTGGEDMDPAWYGESPSPKLGSVDRERDLFELALFAAARQREIPILGICRGIQVINVALGGTLWQDLPSERQCLVDHDAAATRAARTHRIDLAPGSRVAGALGTERMMVNSMHHQGIKDLAPQLTATAWAEDGLIEAVESAPDAPWLMAVQWHPEEMFGEAAAPERGLFTALAEEARRASAPA